jgi:CO/xanthine dehydrogenase Mo-binding subunit
MKAPKVNKWEDSPRIDSREKVTGQAKYVEDIPDLPGMAYGANVLSPYSHARILAIDSSRAERLPGVLGVLHRGCLDGLNPMLPAPRHELFTLTADQTFIATDKVRFDGELVAQVVAEDLRTAQQAAELIEVEYEVLPAVFDAEEALSPSAPVLHEDRGTNLLLEDKMEWGDVEQGLKEADRIFEETYTSPSMFHHPMEDVGSCIAQFTGGEITLWAPTSSPFRDAQEIAHFFGIDAGRVRVRVPYIGGGFGSKVLTRSMLGALFLSRKIGRPVKLHASAEESFRQSARHAMVYKAKVGVRSDGTLSALEVKLAVDTGAYTTGAATVTHNAVISAWGCYRIPHLRVTARCAYTNKVPASHTRATGKVQTTWGVECALDHVARQMGIDPMDFKAQNVLRRGEFVAKGTPNMDTDYFELIRQATSAIHWDGRAAKSRPSGSEQTARSLLARGRAVVLSLRHGSQGGGRAYALVSMDRRGILKIQHNAPEIGQGTHNIISVVASRILEIPQDQIQVGHPDTSIDLPFAGVSAQRTTVQMGKAVENACEKLKQELVALASQNKGGSPEEWQVADGRLWRAESAFSYGEIVGTLGGGSTLKTIGFHNVARTERGSAFGGMDHWAPSAAAAEVEVDRETGELRVLQFAVVADAGKALHYASAKAQVDGGAVMGFGHALFEEVVYQDGQLLNADPFQYRLPVMRDIPESFHSSMLENQDGPGPFGSKGMSQTSIVCVAPAIGNAIYDAIGGRIRDLPITPEKILRAMGKI